METLIETYGPTIASFGVIGGLLLIQLLVADVLGIVSGHTPGTGVPPNHDDKLFRATRAHANTNESIASFLAIAVFGIAVSAAPVWLNNLSLLYVAGRIGHMCCYYADLRVLRSLFFAVSLLALFGMLTAGWVSWLVM